MAFLTNFEINWRSLESVVSIYLELKFGEFEHIGKIIHKGHYILLERQQLHITWCYTGDYFPDLQRRLYLKV